jgi:hypothetical protein
VATPTGTRLILNVSTARFIGISIPSDVRQSAAAVIGK